MKKINKKNLQQLAETVAILTESEQKRCIGSAFYYSPEGESLGLLGNGYDIRIIDSETFNSLKYVNDDNCLFGSSTSFYSTSHTIQDKVLNTLAYSMGINSYVYVSFTPDNNGAENLGAAIHSFYYGNYVNSMITLNYGSSIFYGANLYDLICILTHESDHIQNYNNGQSYNTVASEFYALTAEIYSEYFQYTSERYKEGIQNQHHYYANLYYNLYY